MKTINQNELKAIKYAERHGIAHFTRKGTKMIYREYFSTATYRVTVDLKTLTEIERKQTKGVK